MAFRPIGISRVPGPAIFTLDEASQMFCVSITAGSFRTMEKFAFVDFVIVRNVDDSFLSSLIIEDCMHPKANMSGDANHRAAPRHRDIVARHRLARTTKKRTSMGQEPKITGLGILTIVLEVVRANLYCIAFTSFNAKRHAESPYNALAVVYKRRLGLESRSQGFYLHLETSIPIILDPLIYEYRARMRSPSFWNPREQPSDVPPMLFAITVLSVGQAPPKRFPSLSPCILRSIALFATDLEHPKPYWRRQLLALGLISKAWSMVLDLFFEVHCEPRTEGKSWPTATMGIGGAEECRSSLLSMTSALLAARPQRALLMRKFSLSNYREYMDSDTKLALLAATKVVLRLARNLREIDFALEFLNDQDLMKALGCLRFLDSVKTGIYFDTTENSQTSAPILQAVFEWPFLTSFVANGSSYRVGNGRGRFALDKRTDTRLPCSLVRLSLTYWSINGPIFAKFFNVARPRMEHLHLANISGLTNLDLYNGLVIMANSLIEIGIINCEIEKGEDNEHAIDALISQFPLLRRLCVSSKHISYRTIQKRARRPENTITSLSIFQLKEAASFFGPFPRALERSPGAWGTISIFSSGLMTQEDMAAINRTRVAGHEIGVNVLHLHGMDPYNLFY